MGHGIGGKIDNFFEKRELPMYKDKPYSYSASTRNPPLYRRWRVIGGGLLVLLGLAYWTGFFSPGSTKAKPKSAGKTSWSFLSRPDVSVDWDSRREKVREAFILSWDGYEQYAWGMSDCESGVSQWYTGFNG